MDDAVVETRYGRVRGRRQGAVLIWKGVPYARPPVGHLRFRPPEPPEPWTGVRDALDFAPAALQPGGRYRYTDEDCLYLNVWSPGVSGSPRPVMVWIHGGGFMVGSGSDPVFDGASFAERCGVVLVTFNYRLGVMGFLDLRHVAGAGYELSGQLGMLDQLAALRWVRDNIAAFGGDPDCVTIFGQSAGGRSVGLLLALPEARGLFHRAIAMGARLEEYRRPEQARRMTDDFLAALGIDASRWQFLLEADAARLMAASPPLRPDIGFEPTVGDGLFPRLPLEVLAAESACDIPVMIGWARDEITPFFDPTWNGWGMEDIAAHLERRYGLFWRRAWAFVAEKYAALPTDLDRMAKLLTFRDFAFPAFRLAEIQSSHGAPCWVYRFDYAPAEIGFAPHGVEVPFVFNRLAAARGRFGYALTPEEQALAARMQDVWAAFAKTGKPEAAGLPPWPPYTPERRAVMAFDVACRVEVDPDGDERRLWA